MLKAILTTDTGEVIASRDLTLAFLRFPPAILSGDWGIFFLVKLRSPSVAIYQSISYYYLEPTPIESEEFTGEFPGYIPYLPRSAIAVLGADQ